MLGAGSRPSPLPTLSTLPIPDPETNYLGMNEIYQMCTDVFGSDWRDNRQATACHTIIMRKYNKLLNQVRRLSSVGGPNRTPTVTPRAIPTVALAPPPFYSLWY